MKAHLFDLALLLLIAVIYMVSIYISEQFQRQAAEQDEGPSLVHLTTPFLCGFYNIILVEMILARFGNFHWHPMVYAIGGSLIGLLMSLIIDVFRSFRKRKKTDRSE